MTEQFQYQLYQTKQESIEWQPLTTIPKAGWWVFPGSTLGCITRFAAGAKPNWLHRTMMRVLLGFKWEDEK